MLEMHQVTKVYRTDLIETHALREFSLNVDKGEFVAVIGPSGSGKTTFLNVAGLLDTFDSGTYQLDGQDVCRLADDASSRMRNEKIGFIFQSFNLIPDLDVFDNVDVPLRYRRLPAAERRERIDRGARAGRARLAHEAPAVAALRRPAAARRDRARARRRPALILADEPTGNLDSLMAREVMDLLEQINGMGTTIVMVTHDPELARRAHRNVQVIDGQITDFKPYEPPRRHVTLLHPPAPDAARRLTARRTTMFAYDLRLALQSLKRHPGLSALMVLAIALGIAVCTVPSPSTTRWRRTRSRGKSDQLYAVTLDTWDPSEPYDDEKPELPPHAADLSRRDLRCTAVDIPQRSVVMYKSGALLLPERAGASRSTRCCA